MWAANYWPNSYWTPDYWSNVGGKKKAGAHTVAGAKKPYLSHHIMFELLRQQSIRERLEAFQRANGVRILADYEIRRIRMMEAIQKLQRRRNASLAMLLSES